MPFLPIPGRTLGPAVVFAPADKGHGASLPGYESEVTQLDARITDLGLSGSNPSLQVRARDGMNWTVELGDKAAARKAGLTDKLAVPGDPVTVHGLRASGFGDSRIRAVSLTIDGRNFALMPDACLEA